MTDQRDLKILIEDSGGRHSATKTRQTYGGQEADEKDREQEAQGKMHRTRRKG
jgi:hypothetical protein